MAVHVWKEASRCLNCKKPMCMEGCPIKTPIPKMIAAFKSGDLNAAGEMLFLNNPLSMVCSLVCDHGSQCEGHCVLGRKGDPVHISSIENYVSDTYFDKMKIECAPKNGMKVAVIGAGPAGITIAIELTKKGYDVTIFDAKDQIGGVLRYGIPAYRLPKSILDRYKKKLLEIGIKIRPNTTIGGALEIKDLFRDGYKSIFIGTGVWRPRTLNIKGESLGNVHFAIDYLANPDVYDLGESVAIIGMGNSAIDVARTALRKGVRKVTLYSRDMNSPASEEELAMAKIDGAELKFGWTPHEITDQGPMFIPSLCAEDGSYLGCEGEPVLKPADSTIVSVSQGPKSKLVDTTEGLKATKNGLLQTDENGQTTLPGIFAAGDVVLGAKTVVQATAYAKRVAEAMDRYMQGNAAEESTEA